MECFTLRQTTTTTTTTRWEQTEMFRCVLHRLALTVHLVHHIVVGNLI